jgi:hypothetical protein
MFQKKLTQEILRRSARVTQESPRRSLQRIFLVHPLHVAAAAAAVAVAAALWLLLLSLLLLRSRCCCCALAAVAALSLPSCFRPRFNVNLLTLKVWNSMKSHKDTVAACPPLKIS